MFNSEEIKYEGFEAESAARRNLGFNNVQNIDTRFHPWIGLRRNREKCEAAANPNPTYQPNIGDGCVVMQCKACTGTNDDPQSNNPNTDKGTTATCPQCGSNCNIVVSGSLNVYGLTRCDRDFDNFRTGFRGDWAKDNGITVNGKNES